MLPALSKEWEDSRRSTSHTRHLPDGTPAPSSLDDSRIHKIRIVERLLHSGGPGGVLGLGLDGALGVGGSPGSKPGPVLPPSDDGWLDDTTLSTLSTNDLEKLMDQFLVRVVQQLVQFATLDDDLKTELDHVDSWCVAFKAPC